MGYDERTAERVRQSLRGRRNVVEKRMVGGLSFMLDGSMCCGVTGDRLMVLVDPAGYHTDAALKAWLQRGIDFVSTIPAKSRRIRSGETRP